jgi:outer membrane receptor protein involved in Fe transport
MRTAFGGILVACCLVNGGAAPVNRRGKASLVAWLLLVPFMIAPGPNSSLGAEAVIVSDYDDASQLTKQLESNLTNSDDKIRPAAFQPQIVLEFPQSIESRLSSPFAAERLASGVFDDRMSGRRSLISSTIPGAEARLRATTDAGDLLGKSPRATGVGVQRRGPISNDPRIRASRVGRAVSGSYWVPARIDLDTPLSKIDSRIVDGLEVVKGPYRSIYGPEFGTINVDWFDTPRYEALEWHGATIFDYKTNGEQVHGRQRVWGGDQAWGMRMGYGHRTGNDYESGNDLEFPSSYNWGEADVALGFDLDPDTQVELNLLRVDQNDVEFPGYAFDIDWLVTDGYEVEYVRRDQHFYDELSVDTWYNRTRFEGNAQREGKRRQFPFFDTIGYTGSTDVDSMSTGYRAMMSWGDPEVHQLSIGTDLRFVKQELNEISSFNAVMNANSPLPRSASVNPGLFIEDSLCLTDRLRIVLGGRADAVAAEITEDPSELAMVGTDINTSLEELLGTGDFEQTFELASIYLTGEYQLYGNWSLLGAAGRAERAPNLTELYVAETFLFVLQNGLNTLTGDPNLRKERLWQVDLGLRYEDETFRFGVTGFHAWIQDYVTFENTGVFPMPPEQPQQVFLQYVNTDLATFAGFEIVSDYDVNEWLTPFVTISFVDGRDRTRRGEFATVRSDLGQAKEQIAGEPRGSRSGVAGADEEPLPSIPPLDTRLGVRIHDPLDDPRWGLELSVRIVDDQDRVATSLRESPTPGFSVWDVRGQWRATDRFLLTAGIENLGDVNYREHLDFRSLSGGISVFQPGRNVYVGGELVY